jgi:hypothetical protein
MMAKSRATGTFVHTAATAVTTPDTVETAVEAAMEGNGDPEDGDSRDSDDSNSNSNLNKIPMQMDIDIPSSFTNTFSSPSLSHLTSDTPATSPPSVPSHTSKGKQKQSAHDSDEGEPIASSKSKRHSNARYNMKSNMKSSVQESKGLGPAMMTNVAGTLNCLSDAMVMSVSATPQGVIQSAVQIIQQGHDNLMENKCMYLTKIVSDNANKASAYIAQDKLKSRYRWIMMELEPYCE